MVVIIGYNKHQGSKWPQIGLGLGIFFLIIMAIILANVFAAQNKPEKNKPAAKTTTTSSSSSTVAQWESSAREIKIKEEKQKLPLPLSNLAMKVEQIIFCSNVRQNNLPVDSLSEISLDQAGRVYCYTQVTSLAMPQTIHHVWINPQGQLVADIKLIIHNQPANTWSYINLSGQTAGQWTVQVIGPDGKIMAKKSLLLK